jgi:microcompartment protein CcmL/EutN
MRQSIDGWIVGNARKLQLCGWKMLAVSGDVGNVMAAVESDTE